MGDTLRFGQKLLFMNQLPASGVELGHVLLPLP